MNLLNFGVLVLAFVAQVYSQSQFHLTPNIVAVEQDIDAGQQLCSLEDLRIAIGIQSPFTLEIEQTSDQASNGLRRQKLRILYDGILVRVVKLQASVDENDCYTGAVSGYYPTNFPAAFDVSGSRTANELRTAIASYMNANDVFPPFVTSITEPMLENFSEEKQILIDTTTGAPQLVHFVRCLVDVSAHNGAYIRHPRGLIRVSDLSVIIMDLIVLKESDAQTTCPKADGGNLKFPGNEYGPGNNRICLNAEKNGPTCTYRNDDVVIMTVHNSFERDNAEIVSFKCSKGPEDEINGGFSPSSDAFYFSQVFFKMLQEWAQYTNTRTEPITVIVHFGDEYPNSFFDGTGLTMGDGTNFTYPIAVQEIIGHELGHILTAGFGNLQLSTETVALNEAFSDVCGKAVSVFEGELEWTFAKRFVKHETALRYFNNPPLDSLGIDHINNFDITKGVYSLMGIVTKFIYNLVEVEEMSYRDAFQTMVFANQIYWNEESSIIDGLCGVLRSASDLALDTQAILDAAIGVGVDLTFCDISGTQDVILYQPGSSDIDRQPIVSKSKNPKYVIKPAPGLTSVEVSVTSNNDVTLFVVLSGTTTEFPANSITLTMGTEDVVVGLKSGNEEAFTADLTFSFN